MNFLKTYILFPLGQIPRLLTNYFLSFILKIPYRICDFFYIYSHRPKTINIVFVISNQYLTFVPTLAYSILEKNKRNFINFYLVCIDDKDSSTSLNLTKIQKLEKAFKKCKFNILHFPKDLLSKIMEHDTNLGDDGTYKVGQYAKYIWTREFLPWVIPNDVKKIIYMDTDIICQGNLLPLWNSLEENDNEFFSARIDEHFRSNMSAPVLSQIAGVKTFEEYSSKVLGLKKEEKYFNNGIKLINLEKVRNEVDPNVYLLGLSNYMKQPDTIYSEQDYNTIIYQNLTKPFSRRFNCFFFENLWFRSAILIHFVADNPWSDTVLNFDFMQKVLYPQYAKWHRINKKLERKFNEK